MQVRRRWTWWSRSSLVVFGIALLASLAIHLPIYEVLGELAEVLLHAPPERENTTVELELAPLADSTAEPPAEPAPDEREKPDEPPEEQPRAKAREVEPLARRRQAEPKEVEPEPVVPVPAVPVPPPPAIDNPLSVTQKSDDPNVDAPENPRFVAEENRRVEEETVARVRNMHRDDPDPTATTRPSQAQPDEPGNAEEDDVADLHDLKGSDERRPDPTEAQHRPEQASQPSAGEREAKAVPSAAPTSPAPSPEVAPQRASGAPETGGEPETLVVQDGAGSFVIRKAPDGRGPGEQGGDENPGAPSAERDARKGSRAQSGSGANLRVTWSQFEAAFGEEELRAQRETYLEQRRSRTQGGDRKKMWRSFRAAIENFVPNVRPGEQTALNTAASPFAAYLAEVHRRIHREFAHRFLGSLPIAGGPFGDRSLHAVLEIVINGDGTLHQVGVTLTSGFLPFDYGAFNSMMRAAPYPAPPRKILSGDGRVYVHWGFYRNERQCGTFNARPFILPHPDGTPAPGQGPLKDQGRQPPEEQREPAIYDYRDGELGRLGPRAPRARDGGGG